MALAIEQLAALGISSHVLDLWRRHGISALLPLQEKALAEHGFLHGESLLVFAPTSSGKTFVAEMAALKRLEKNRRVVYLVPTKALAEEKFKAFRERYGPLGYRIAVATRERPDADGVVLAGRYDLLVAVYEKMKSYLVARPEMLANVALVVVDEVQTLGEAGRGATLDLLLTKIRKAPYSTQIIGLSAVLGDDAQRLADWLGCDLLLFRQRPVELREGALDLASGTFHYRTFNARERGEESLGSDCDEPLDRADDELESADFRREALLALVRYLAEERGEQALLFVPTRYMSRNWAHHLASRLRDLAPATDVIAELNAYESSFSRELLAQALAHGVAFHNADLSWDLRTLIEQHFNSGAIRVLISTSTLGQGVNLKGRNVLHVPAMVDTDAWTGRSALVALSRSRFRNQGGRAARWGGGSAFGRSILLGRNAMECERLIRDYVEGDIEALTPRISLDSLDVCALDLIASRGAATCEDLTAFLHDTFSGRAHWQIHSTALARRIEETVEGLIGRHLLARSDSRLTATGLGEVAATTGLEPATIGRIADWLRQGPRLLEDDPLEALLVLAATPDGRAFAMGGQSKRESAEVWLSPLRERLAYRSEGACEAVRALLEPEGGFSREALEDFRKALALDAWIGPAETREIEERFGAFSGTLANLASHFAWLAHGAGAMARALGLAERQCAALESLGERLALGCAEEGRGFRALRVAGFSRAYIHALLREGYGSIAALAEADLEALARLIPRRVAQDLLEEARRYRATQEANHPPRSPMPEAEEEIAPAAIPAASTAPQADAESPRAPFPYAILEIVGLEGVAIGGREFALPREEMLLLDFLAQVGEEGAIYADLAAVVWPGTHRKWGADASRERILALRARLVRAFAEALGEEEAESLLPMVPERGLLLDLPPKMILRGE